MRARVRAELTEQIKASARAQLAVDGANLSMRAVARELGMVSSALYRYFASRDELLTALITDAYVDLACDLEAAESRVSRRDLLGRWRAIACGVRTWAVAHPYEYALLYGSPVPGYQAPQSTIQPASVPLRLLVALALDADAQGLAPAAGPPRLPPELRSTISELADLEGLAGLPAWVFAHVAVAWTHLFGAVSFERFGRLQGSGLDYALWFDYQADFMAGYLGLTRPGAQA